MSRTTIPAWASRLLAASVPKGPERDAILGDFEEELFDLSAEPDGPRRARAWYVAQVLRSCTPFIALRLRQSTNRRGLSAMAVGWCTLIAGFATVAVVSTIVLNMVGAGETTRRLVIFVLAMATPIAAGAASGIVVRGKDPFAAYAFALPAALTIAGILMLSTEQESAATWLVWLAVVPGGALIGARSVAAMFPPQAVTRSVGPKNNRGGLSI